MRDKTPEIRLDRPPIATESFFLRFLRFFVAKSFPPSRPSSGVGVMNRLSFV
jgi:hypothetical protein